MDAGGATLEGTGGPGRRVPPTGLTDAEVLERRGRVGENRLPTKDGVSALRILLRQFASPLVLIILAAAGISLALGELGDFAIILIVVIADVLLGFAQEYRAQRAYVALKGLLRPTATVIRGGRREQVEVWELVPGDVVVLNAGDRIPADGVVVEAVRLAVDEAILTGESEPVPKHVPDGPASTVEAADEVRRGSSLFMGSTVVTGRAVLVVAATGLATELGQIASGLSERDESATPLQVRLGAFSRLLTLVVVGATLAILGVGLAFGREFFGMLRTAIVLAVAAVPEGLIIAVTVILVLGMQAILRRHGLVRRLLAVETLGAVTVICTDKTGTLTEGRMRVSRVAIADQERAWQTMVLCNDLEGPVDVALWAHAEERKPGGPQDLADEAERIAEELFTSETKYMIAAVTASALAGERHYFLKGAPEVVLAMCELARDERDRLLAEADHWAGEGLRLIGLAHRLDGTLEDHTGYAWVGLVGLEDPVRDGVIEAVAIAHRAGVRVVMVTGDYRRTAESIAAAIGIPVDGGVLEGADVAGMTDEELRSAVATTAVFARIRPGDKLRIVRALDANGEVTAMIGDGVNDAPALTHADIGVVVGTASDVAKETADLILLDSNFRTIVAAVEEGRVIFDNIRKLVAYVLSNSFAEMATIFVALMLGWPAPLLVAQILWIHLICDGPLDLVLGFEPAEPAIMERRPLSTREPILDRLGASLIATISTAAATVALALFGVYHLVLDDTVGGRSLVFATFACSSAVYILAYRSMRTPLWRMAPLTANPPLVAAMALGIGMTFLPFLVPGLGAILGVAPLRPLEWALVAGIALTLLAIVEGAKLFATRSATRPSRASGV